MKHDPVEDLRSLCRESWTLMRAIDDSLDKRLLLAKDIGGVLGLLREFSKKYAPIDHGVLGEDDLELVYQPASLRPASPCRRKWDEYAAAYEIPPARPDSDSMSYAVFAGPFQGLCDALEVVPRVHAKGVPVICRLNMDGTDEVLYEWDRGESVWRRRT